MPGQVLRIYDRLEAAESSRNALIDAGFPGSNMSLSSQADEAGALQGNFVAGNPKIGSAADGNYDDNFGDVQHSSIYLLLVKTADVASQQRALSLMERFGGRDMDTPISKT